MPPCSNRHVVYKYLQNGGATFILPLLPLAPPHLLSGEGGEGSEEESIKRRIETRFLYDPARYRRKDDRRASGICAEGTCVIIFFFRFQIPLFCYYMGLYFVLIEVECLKLKLGFL
jgi:hypothetical protein